MVRLSKYVALFLFTGAIGCSNSTDSPPTAESKTELDITCTDSIDSIYGAPTSIPDEKGAIMRCAKDKELSKEDIAAALKDYKGKAPSTGAKVFRIVYRTERGGPAKKAGYSSALIFMPLQRKATKVPIVVASRGSRGQAASCAVSKKDPTLTGINEDFDHLVLPFVGQGFVVIAPDLAGYANYGAADNPPSAYAFADDVAKSTLDGARALKKAFGSNLTDDVVLIGHSQGGHTALSALAHSEGYGSGLKIAAVATYAPLWLSNRTWGGVFLLADSYPLATFAPATTVPIWYHYTLGYLLDGPTAALDPFLPKHHTLIKQFVDSTCWTSKYPSLEAAGKDVRDFFKPEFIEAVKGPAAVGVDCPTDEPAKGTCEKWIARYRGDRPPITGNAAKVPLLVAYGGKDSTIPPDRLQCALDRLKKDTIAPTECYEPDAEHGSILSKSADYVVDWVASKTLGTAAPTTTCTKMKIDLGVTCAALPPND